MLTLSQFVYALEKSGLELIINGLTLKAMEVLFAMQKILELIEITKSSFVNVKDRL